MATMYVTFGQVHEHWIDDKWFNKDCVAVIECKDATDGRTKAMSAFGKEFCFTHFEADFDQARLDQFYPRGLIEL